MGHGCLFDLADRLFAVGARHFEQAYGNGAGVFAIQTLKTLIVLAPGGLMGAGVGALIGAFSMDPASPAVFPLQVVGIMLWLGAIGFRVLLSEAELRLSTFAGLISNSV